MSRGFIPHNRHTNVLRYKYVIGALVSANTLAKLERALAVFELGVPTQYLWEKAIFRVGHILESMCSEICANNLEKEAKPLEVMSDCGWNFRGFTSPMGTVSVIGLRSHRMLAVCPLLNETKIANYKGTAKGMEGEGTRRIARH